MKYKVVVARSIRELETMVNAFLLEGWEPQGGMSLKSFTETTGNQYYLQPIVKDDEDAQAKN